MKLPRLILALSAASLLSVGCASTDDKGDDLDVPMEDKKAEEKPVTYQDIISNKGGASTSVPKSAVTNWQAFFKAPPSQKEKNILEQKLDKWQDGETPAQLIEKGRAEIAVGRLGNAETSFRKALRLKGDDLDAQLELASLYLRKNDTANAFDLLEQTKEGIDTSDKVSQSFIFRYRYILALGYIARGDREKGHKVLSDLIGVERTFGPAYVSLASSYLSVGKESVAEFVIRRGLDRVKDSAALMNLMGVISQKAKQFEAARSWYDKALAASPNYAPALVNRATLSTLTLEYGAAEEDLLQALVVDARNVDALVALGIVQRRQGNFNGARSSFSKAVDVDPDNAYARFNLGVLLADDLKKPNEAVRLFHEVIQTTSQGSELRELARNYINDLKPSGEPY